MDSKYELLATKEDVAKLELKLIKTFVGVNSDIFKWLFVFWIGQIAITFGLIWFFLNK